MANVQRPSRRLPASLLAATVLVLFALVALAARGGLHGSVLNPRGGAQTATSTRTTRLFPLHGSGGGGALTLPHWIGWAALGLVAAFLIAIALHHLPTLHRPRGWAGRSSSEDGAADFRHDPSVEEAEAAARQAALRDAVLRSLEEIRRDPDARRAIIGAYRLMEAALARTGVPRGPAEAPREYLARALSTLDVGPAAPRRLTALFERARFHDAELALSLRDQAVDALLELERAL